jgi:hypothetical protein
MTDYVLKISSYESIVAGASHYRGVIWGPHPQSCHGASHFNAPQSRGKHTCDEGHEIPARVEWQVEDYMTEEAFERQAARHFEDPGSAQMKSEAIVVQVAVSRFLETRERLWFEPHRPELQPGDKLYLKWLPGQVDHDDEWAEPGEMTVIAEIPLLEPERESEVMTESPLG